MEYVQQIWDWFWAIRTNEPLTQWVAGNAILLAVTWKGWIEFKKYRARLTPDTADDEAVAKLEQIGNDMFRIVLPEKKEPPVE
jgi:hypothetical protein